MSKIYMLDRQVFAVLVRAHHAEDDTVSMSQAAIAAAVGLRSTESSSKCVRDALRRLAASGAIERVEQSHGPHPCRYRILEEPQPVFRAPSPPALGWAARVRADRKLSRLAVIVAWTIDTDRERTIDVAGVAAQLGRSRGHVSDALRELERRGHIALTRWRSASGRSLADIAIAGTWVPALAPRQPLVPRVDREIADAWRELEELGLVETRLHRTTDEVVADLGVVLARFGWTADGRWARRVGEDVRTSTNIARAARIVADEERKRRVLSAARGGLFGSGPERRGVS